MKFVQLTTPDGREIFINLQLVTEIIRFEDKNETKIYLSRPGGDGDGDFSTVQETPQQILTAKPAFNHS